MKIVGYVLFGQDNGTRMFGSDSAVARCGTCGYILDVNASNPDYVLRRADLDISSTFENRVIVSRAFKKFCEQAKCEGVTFRGFSADRDHFHLTVAREVSFDPIARKTRFEKKCPSCGNYEAVAGATPAFLKIKEPLPDGFFRTDVLFGSGDERQPLIIVGVETKAKLEKAGLRGLEFAPAYAA